MNSPYGPAGGQVSRPQVSVRDLASWCQRHLNAVPAAELFTTGHLSLVKGLHLSDGRDVVVKVRPQAQRLNGCHATQEILHTKGFPCPLPLVGPAALNSLGATAEMYVPGGEVLSPSPRTTELYAEALAQMIATAPAPGELPSVKPAPPWAGWDHDQAGIWPIADDRDADLNCRPGPAWLDSIGLRIRSRLARPLTPEVIGHVDWEAHNLRWHGARLHAVHDWDSVASRPEAAVLGLAAAVHTASGEPLTEATNEQIEGFLSAYEQARGRVLAIEEREVSWAAGLWVRAFNAKKDSLDGDGPSLDRLASEAPKRLRLAGA